MVSAAQHRKFARQRGLIKFAHDVGPGGGGRGSKGARVGVSFTPAEEVMRSCRGPFWQVRKGIGI